MRYEHILVGAHDGLATVTLDRPARRNALSEALLAELLAAVRALGDDPEIRAVVLAANGPVFSAGHDLREMLEHDLDGTRRVLAACTETMRALQRLPVPVVASVQGLATAAGCQLVASCDLAVAAEEAQFATPGGKGGWFCTTPMVPLVRAVGPRRALEMLLTGEPIDAATALAWGLVNRVVPRAELAVATETLARRASQGSPAAKALGKRAFWDTAHLDIDAAYAHAGDVMARSALTDDAREFMRAPLEKRPAVYSTRR
ncbi:MAG: enoyl-CoA hydratase-related protein [Candidatus Binatia bacterium]